MTSPLEPHDEWNASSTKIMSLHPIAKLFNFYESIDDRDELSLVKLGQKNPLLPVLFSKWLSNLNEERKRTVVLTTGFREKGNQEFNEGTGPNDLAADYYTNAIFTAPKKSVELALAHANRAASLVQSERFYEEGYFDCKLALKCNYPAEKLLKLFERMQYLAEQTNRREEYIAEMYAEMKKRNMKLDDEQELFLAEYQAGDLLTVNQYVNDDRKNDQRERKFKNKNLTEQRNESVGRYLITESPIAKNKLVYGEKAFSFVPTYPTYQIDEDEVISYACQNCAKINCLPFPCYECARASYCSPTCLAAHEPIHKYECVGHQKNLWIKLSAQSGNLAFRTCIVGFKDLVLMLADKEASTVEEVWSMLKLDQHSEFPYGQILRLVAHTDLFTTKFVVRLLFTAQLMTTYLSECTDFFSKLPEICLRIMPNVEDWKMLMGALMLKHMGQVLMNGIWPCQLLLQTPVSYGKSYGYGSFNIHLNDLHLVLSRSCVFTCLFPKMSILNHSCDPNVRMHLDGPNLCVHAISNISAKEEVCVSYGLDYKLASRKDRQYMLNERYYFKCKCNMCESHDDDERFFVYYGYFCPPCEKPVILKEFSICWWKDLNDDKCLVYEKKIVCDECGTRLPLRPKELLKFRRPPQQHGRTDDLDATEEMLNVYFSMSDGLSKYHELRSAYLHTILGYNILDSDVYHFPGLARITMDNYVNLKERYGRSSVDFIFIASCALAILKLSRRVERTNVIAAMARDINKIRRILNRKVIKRSLVILPLSLQTIFKNAIRDAFVDENSANQLPLARLNVGCRD